MATARDLVRRSVFVDLKAARESHVKVVDADGSKTHISLILLFPDAEERTARHYRLFAIIKDHESCAAREHQPSRILTHARVLCVCVCVPPCAPPTGGRRERRRCSFGTG